MNFKCHKRFITNISFAISIILSLSVGLPAMALSNTSMDEMPHENISVIDCISQHHVSTGVAEKISSDKFEIEDDEIAPDLTPYFVQFQKPYVNEQQTKPKDIVISPSFNPPDIIRLTSNIRF